MHDDNKRDPMPPPDATPEEIGEFWDTHSLADYWDETEEVEFQVNLKSDQNQTLSDETKPDLPATTEDSSNTALDVVTEDTAGTDIDTVADVISSLNLPIWMLRNASKAFRQLCSAAVEWPSAFFRGKASERHAITEANTKITEAVTDQIIQQINVPPEYAQIAVGKHIEKIIGEQINLDKISAIAANELKNSESGSPTHPDTSEPTQEQPANSSNPETNSSEEKVIDDDWLNSFGTEARQKSTEDMQLRFGRILAGEIQKPGSYSIRAIKVLGELDKDTAALFKRFCSACVVVGDLGIPNNEQVFDARVLSLGGSLGSDALSKYGLGLNQLDILNEYSLITSGNILLHDYNLVSLYDYNLCIEYEDNPRLVPFQHQGKNWILSPTPERDNTPEFRLSGVMLSRVGCELFRIVDQDPMPEYTEALKKIFEEQQLRMVEV